MKKMNRKLVDLFLTKKRRRKALRKIALAHKRAKHRLRAWEYRNLRAYHFGTTSVVAKMLSNVASCEAEMPQSFLRLTVPKIFSMQDAPGDVIEFISSFARTHVTRLITDVYVDFSPVEKQDLGAHALLDLLIEEIKMQASFRGVRIHWKGKYPKGQAERRFICSMGIIRVLDLKHHFLAPREANKIVRFERRCRNYIHRLRKADPNNKTEQSNAARRFADHIDRCLQKEGRRLTLEARSDLCSYVVEIIDNAERHAGMVDWTIQGYIDLNSDQPHCEIVILNLGRSIAQSMAAVPRGSYTYDLISEYIDIHSRSGWFRQGWDPAALYTLIALQGRVSSRNLTRNDTGGQGTADLIEFFQAMHAERLAVGTNARMYIISGSTKVLIDGRYQIVKNGAFRNIAFNDANDLRKPPDRSSVMTLDGPPLPGTIIGIKFPIQADSLQEASTP